MSHTSKKGVCAGKGAFWGHPQKSALSENISILNNLYVRTQTSCNYSMECRMGLWTQVCKSILFPYMEVGLRCVAKLWSGWAGDVARSGWGRVWRGKVRSGRVWCGKVRMWRGKVRSGHVWRGKFRLGRVWRGKFRLAVRVELRYVCVMCVCVCVCICVWVRKRESNRGDRDIDRERAEAAIIL